MKRRRQTPSRSSPSSARLTDCWLRIARDPRVQPAWHLGPGRMPARWKPARRASRQACSGYDSLLNKLCQMLFDDSPR
jgi:hypothetical protein